MKPAQLKLIYYGFYTLLITGLLSACGNREMNDLKQYVKQIKARENPHVEAIPEFRYIPSYFYEVQHMRDPFIPLEKNEGPILPGGDIFGDGTATDNKKGPCPSPGDPNRVRVGLEQMPIDVLKMVGTLRMEGILWALLESKADNNVYRVKQGDYIGENFGKIINITEDELEVLEYLPDDEGCWKENRPVLSLFGKR